MPVGTDERWGPNTRPQSRLLVLRERTREVERAAEGRGMIAEAEKMRQQIILLGQQRRALLLRLREYTATYESDRFEIRRIVRTERIRRKYRLTWREAFNIVVTLMRKEQQ